MDYTQTLALFNMICLLLTCISPVNLKIWKKTRLQVMGYSDYTSCHFSNCHVIASKDVVKKLVKWKFDRPLCVMGHAHLARGLRARHEWREKTV